MLEAFGVEDTEERIYRALLRTPRGSLGDIARAVRSNKSVLLRSLKWLEAEGLVSRIPGRPVRYAPTPPDVAVEVLARQRIEAIDRARAGTAQLIEEFRGGAERVPEDIVQVVRGREAVVQRFEQLQRGAQRRVRILDRPPYARGNSLNTTELELLQRGLRFQVLYDVRAFEVGRQLEWLQQLTEAGEEARTLPDLPLKLVLADDRRALVPLSMDQAGVQMRLLIYPSPLLDALGQLFDILWDRAIPVWEALEAKGSPGENDASLSTDERQILALMAAGLKDAAVARQLGVGLRTVRRRIGRIMEQLDAQTRYQAGMQAARRGLS